MFPLVAILALSLSMWFGMRIGSSQYWLTVLTTIPPPPPVNEIHGGLNLTSGTSATPTPTPHPAINFGLFFEVPAAEEALSESPFKPTEGGKALAVWTPANDPQLQIDWILWFWISILVVSLVAVIAGLLRYRHEVARYHSQRRLLERPYQPSKPTAVESAEIDVPFNWLKKYCDLHATLKAFEIQNQFLTTQNADQSTTIATLGNKSYWASFHAKVSAERFSVELASQKKRADETEKRFEEYRNEYNLAAAMLQCSNADDGFEAKLHELHQRDTARKEEEVQKLKSIIMTLGSDKKNLQATAARITQERDEARATIESIRAEKNGMLKMVDNLGQEHSEKLQQLIDEKKKIEANVLEVNNNHDKARETIKVLELEKTGLRETLDEVCQEHKKAKESVKNIQAEYALSEEQLGKLRREHTQKLQQLVDEKATLKTRLDDGQAQPDSQDMKQLKARNTELEETLQKVRDDHQTTLLVTMKAHAEELATQNADAKQLKVVNVELEEALQRARDSHQSALEGLAKTHSAELEKQSADADLLKGTNAELNDALRKAGDHYQALLKQQAAELENQHGDAMNQLKAMNAALQDDLKRAQDDLTTHMPFVRAQAAELEEATADANQLRATNEGLQNTLQQVRAFNHTNLANLRSVHSAAIEKQSADAEQLRSAHSAAFETQSAHVEQLKFTNATLQSTLQQIRDHHETNLANLRSAHSAALEKQSVDATQLQATNATLQETVQKLRDSHQSNLRILMRAHCAELETQSTEAKAAHEKELQEATASHVATLVKLKMTHKREVDEMDAEYTELEAKLAEVRNTGEGAGTGAPHEAPGDSKSSKRKQEDV